MATGSRNSNSQWDKLDFQQEETPEAKKRRKKQETKEAKEREREAKRKETKEKEAKKKEANKKEKALKKQKRGEGDKNSQGQLPIPDTTDHFDIPDIPVDLDKTWAVFTGKGRKSSAPSDSSLSPPSPQKIESVSVMPNKVHIIASLICGYLYMYLTF